MNSDSKLKVSNKKQSKHKISEAYRSGQTALGRSPCQGGAVTHVHRRSNPCIQTALGRSPCQGGAATHVHRWSSLPVRLHSAGRRVREEPRHMYTGSLPCRPDRTRHVVVSGRSRDTNTYVANPVARPHSLKYCKLTSPDAIFIQGTVNHHNFILKWMVREKE